MNGLGLLAVAAAIGGVLLGTVLLAFGVGTAIWSFWHAFIQAF